MTTLREAFHLVAIMVLVIWAHTDEARHECINSSEEYCVNE